jgi:prepilin-type N-terminal cleavage/methylation domain-containing protein
MKSKSLYEHKYSCKGITLIEVIVVIDILAVLIALAIPAVAAYLENSTAQTNVANAKTIYEAAHAYLTGNSMSDDADINTSALADTDNLITKMYLDKAPLTAKGNTYAVTSVAKVVTVTWKAETDIAAENPAGTAPTIGDNLTYPTS